MSCWQFDLSHVHDKEAVFCLKRHLSTTQALAATPCSSESRKSACLIALGAGPKQPRTLSCREVFVISAPGNYSRLLAATRMLARKEASASMGAGIDGSTTSNRLLMAAPKGTRPPAAGKGRPKGARNKMTRALKDMILQALDDAGGHILPSKRAKTRSLS